MELAVERLKLLLHCSKNAGDLWGRAFAVLSGKHPESDRWNFEVNTPVDQVVQLIGACHVDIVRMAQPISAAKPSIAIQDQSFHSSDSPKQKAGLASAPSASSARPMFIL